MIRTKDGSFTFFSEAYQENYHSLSGAVEEAFKKYIEPCKINDLAKSGCVKVLDIGFGLGYNVIAAIESAVESNPNCEISIISLEKDKALIKKIRLLKPKLKHYGIINQLEFDPITNSFLYEDKNIYLKIKVGDAVHTITKLSEKFDAVFLDPFSPKNNPELWTEEFFKEIKKRMKKDAVLATYSCARIVRDNLRTAGYIVKNGPTVGRRGPSTIAKPM